MKSFPSFFRKGHFAALLAIWVGGCAVGPDYKRPEIASITPPDWHWKSAEPSDQLPKGEWWKVFGDSTLDQLETQAIAHNQNLRAAVARVDQARASARVNAADFFPEITLDPSTNRSRTSGNAPNPAPFPLRSVTQNKFSVPLDLSYEIDLWGRVRRSFESAQAQAEATVADYRNVLLTLNSDVAYNYFLLRGLDSEVSILHRTVESRRAACEVQQLRFNSGLGRELDYQQAKTQLASAQAEAADTERTREETVNILALLCGQPASGFTLSSVPLEIGPPLIPAGIPSSVLERRPDIAQAERLMAARNAEIGVAYAAFFPSLKLTGQGGFLSTDTSNLFAWESKVWSLGPSLSLPIFEAGRNAAQLKAARATYEESVADYRQRVLTAFKEVEDALLGLSKRAEQMRAQQQALEAAQRATQLSQDRYKSGAENYLVVVDAERTELSTERSVTQIRGQQLLATVRLIKALGGGWDSTSLSKN